ncbi:MAG: DNA alkylation repair protein [Candidatus Heimdallarchaeota archaeon]|nr:DNA alkylation repair protein [Candidatus Heimdallarchaeota archaeon]
MIIKKIREALKCNVDTAYKVGAQRYFKEAIKLYGVRVPKVRKIASEHYKLVKDKTKSEIYDICEKLMQSGFSEEKTIAFSWVFKQKKHFTLEDFSVFASWIEKYVLSWADCDDFCGHALGYLIFMNESLVKKLKSWSKSSNRWLRRASAVSLIYSVKRDKYHTEAFKIAESLLLDDDDLVQKGYGWLLKEISNLNEDSVFEFVYNRREKMPRTALRYAIEKMPPALRKKAMKR